MISTILFIVSIAVIVGGLGFAALGKREVHAGEPRSFELRGWTYMAPEYRDNLILSHEENLKALYIEKFNLPDTMHQQPLEKVIRATKQKAFL